MFEEVGREWEGSEKGMRRKMGVHLPGSSTHLVDTFHEAEITFGIQLVPMLNKLSRKGVGEHKEGMMEQRQVCSGVSCFGPASSSRTTTKSVCV